MSDIRPGSGRPIGGRHIATATGCGIVVLIVVGLLLWWAMGSQDADVDYADLARTAVIAMAAIGAVPAGYIAYRRQRTQEFQREDERENAVRAVDDEFQDRYVDASAQLGHDQAATRMAGVYALARLADEWGQVRGRQARQMCVDVLCAYLRIPYGPQPGAGADRAGEQEVRRTMIRVIRDHLRDDKVRDGVSWSDLSFSFEGAYLDCGDFTKSRFAGDFVSFHGVTFAGGTIHLDDVTFATRASFRDACVQSGVLCLRNATVPSEDVSHRVTPKLTSIGMEVKPGAVLERDGFQNDGPADSGPLSPA